MRGGPQSPPRPLGREKYILKTVRVRLNHLRAAMLAAVAAGLLAAVGLLILLYAQPAEANYPGKPGKIAYAGYYRNDSEIFTIKTDGGGKLPLTDNGAGNYQPAYSPNGKQIAYVGFAGNDSEIYTIHAKGGGKRQLTDNSTRDRYPYCSPSGKKIAYINDAGTDREIYTIKPDGGGMHQVIDNTTANFNPYWGSQ